MSTVRTLKIVTTADPSAGGERRIDGEKTGMLAAPDVMGGRSQSWQAQSQSNLKKISVAILQYAQDHDDNLLDADKWVNEIMPYLKGVYFTALFRDPAAPEQGWSYAFNHRLSGVSLSALADPTATVLLFESTKGVRSAADTGGSVPMPGHHNGGTDYAFADGHVKWEADGTKPSFLLTGK